MENFFYKYRFILISFFCTFLIFLLSAIFSTRGVFGDIPCEFFKELISIDFHDNIFEVVLYSKDSLVRFFSYKLALLFFYPFYFLFSDINSLLKLYTFSNLVVPFLLLFFNYLIAKRTKRYDIFILSLFYYCFFEIPYISWFERESHVAVLLQFMVLSYFLSDANLKKIDIFFILPLILLFFSSSFENVVILGLVLFIFSIINYRKNRLKSKHQFYIGIICFVISIYAFFKTYITVYSETSGTLSFAVASNNWLHNLLMLKDSTFTSCMLISLFGFCSYILFVFLFNKFKNQKFFFLISTIFICYYILYKITGFVPDPNKESNLFIYSMIIVPIIYFVTILSDLKEYKLQFLYKPEFIYTIFIVGICQLLWQINSSVYCYNYVNDIKNFLENSKQKVNLLHFNEEDKGYIYDAKCCTTFRSLAVSDRHKIDKILFPDPLHRDYDELDKYYYKTFYNEKENMLFIANIPMNPKSKYWDLTDVLNDINLYNFTKNKNFHEK